MGVQCFIGSVVPPYAVAPKKNRGLPLLSGLINNI